MQLQSNPCLLAVRFVVLAMIILMPASRRVKGDDGRDVIFTSIAPPGPSIANSRYQFPRPNCRTLLPWEYLRFREWM